MDFAGPIRYQVRSKTEGKAYLALYACSLTRGVYLDLLTGLGTDEFLTSLKRFIARRGAPQIIYSDNGATFKAAAKWLRQVQADENVHNYLAQHSIKWQFNLSRAPWWGGQFERLIGLFKAAFDKTIGCATLRWKELTEVVLDIEVALNNRPLNYLEDDIQLPLLTPNAMLHLRPNYLPELETHHVPEPELRRRARYITRCKDAMWSRWTKEYVRSLRERHRQCGGEQTTHPLVGDVVIIQDDQKHRNHWKLGIVEGLIKGRDGIVRAAKLRAGKGILERAIQHLYPIELSCDRVKQAHLNPGAPPFRPQRGAAAAAQVRIQEIAEQEQGEV